MTQRELADLYAKLHRPLYARCLALMGSTHDAEDMVQEVFRRLAERPGGLEQPLFWMLRVAGNVCRNELRRRRREQHALTRESTHMRASVGELSDLVVEHAVLLRLFKRLSPAERAVVSRRWLGDETIENVAADLGIASSTARNLLFRARGKIGDALLRYSAGLGSGVAAAVTRRWVGILRRSASKLGSGGKRVARSANGRGAWTAGLAVPAVVIAVVLSPTPAGRERTEPVIPFERGDHAPVASVELAPAPARPETPVAARRPVAATVMLRTPPPPPVVASPPPLSSPIQPESPMGRKIMVVVPPIRVPNQVGVGVPGGLL